MKKHVLTVRVCECDGELYIETADGPRVHFNAVGAVSFLRDILDAQIHVLHAEIETKARLLSRIQNLGR